MSDSSVPAVIAGLAVGIGLVVIFALFFPLSDGHRLINTILAKAKNMGEAKLFMEMYPDNHVFVRNSMAAYLDRDHNQTRLVPSSNATVVFNSIPENSQRSHFGMEPQGMQLLVYLNPHSIGNVKMELRCGYWENGFQDSAEPVYNGDVVSHLENTDWCQTPIRD